MQQSSGVGSVTCVDTQILHVLVQDKGDHSQNNEMRMGGCRRQLAPDVLRYQFIHCCCHHAPVGKLVCLISDKQGAESSIVHLMRKALLRLPLSNAGPAARERVTTVILLKYKSLRCCMVCSHTTEVKKKGAERDPLISI
jgi:hypothetical protein